MGLKERIAIGCEVPPAARPDLGVRRLYRRLHNTVDWLGQLAADGDPRR
jgi:hypothetical protein